MENKVDYIIVGDGFAALFLAHQLIQNGASFLLFSEGKKGASKVSAGIVNPVILKKFTTFWNVETQIEDLIATSTEIQQYLKQDVLIVNPVVRIFHDESEKQLWMKKSKEETLKEFLNPEAFHLQVLNNDCGVGEVMRSFRLNVNTFFSGMLSYLDENDFLVPSAFDFAALDVSQNLYRGIKFKNIIFCEGMSVLKNPYFSGLPLQPNKGHHLLVKLSKPLAHDFIYKKKHFLFPVDGELYYYGGTYDRYHLEEKIDEAAVKQLVAGLEEIYPYPYAVEEVRYGFRPTTADRRPIIGRHHEFSDLIVFNGLGTRGILNGNYYARKLFQHLQYGEAIPEEVSINRF